MDIKLKQGRKYQRSFTLWIPEGLWKDIQELRSDVSNAGDHYRQAIEQMTEKLKAGVKALKRG